MSIYYISTSDGIVYELDATSNISYTESGQITNHTVESGESVSDHYVNNPVAFSIEGAISDIKALGSINENSKSTADFINGLRNIKINKQQFSFHFGEKVGTFPNCMFENIEVTQTAQNGNVGDIDSFAISADIKQIRIAKKAQVIVARDPLIASQYQTKTRGAGSTQEFEQRDLTFAERATLESKYGTSNLTEIKEITRQQDNGG